MGNRNQVATAASAVFLAPLVGLSMVLLVLGGGGAQADTGPNLCGGGGTGQVVLGVKLDAEQMANARTVVTITANRRLPSYAALVAIDVAYTESTLHNSTVQSDRDSEGLFQQRVSLYTKAVADDPVRATNAFLDRLVALSNWQQLPVGVDAQIVQIPKFPQRYQPNASLAAQVVGWFWASAAAAAPPAQTGSPAAGSSSAPPPIALCSGGGGAVPIVGGHGNNIAGTTTIPAGFAVGGTAKGQLAVQFALKQLGKPYVFGAAGPNAFDCSGLTMAAWAAAGSALPHLASAQTGYGTPEPTDLSQATAGDLVMIPGADGTPTNPGHVGMVAGYVDAKDGRHLYLIQAPETGVPVELTEATEWSGQVVAVRHIA